MPQLNDQAPRICLVLSTGRCGSTLVSNIIRAHPMALSVSELFSGLRDHDLSEREMTGPEFWDMVSISSRTDLLGLRCQLRVDEMLYPAFDPRPGASRFSWETGLPPLMQACIPHLTDRPDDMYAELEEMTPRQPRRLLSGHLMWLFGVLAAGRRPAVLVERSGGSLSYATALLRLFPQARVVHLYRDGRECAVSMSKHARYKLAMMRAALSAQFGFDPYLGTGPGDPDERAIWAKAAGDAELAALMPDRIDRASFDRFDVPLRKYGGMWTKMIVDGLDDLPPSPRLLTLDYTDLIADPARHIGRLLEFAGLDRDPGLESEMAAQVRPPADPRHAVGGQQWHELTRACRLGMNRLYGRDG